MIVVGIRTWTGYSTMVNDDDSCSLTKCRERRRRRIEMRRASITGSSPPANEMESSDGGEEVKRVRRTEVTDASSSSGNDADASSATALIETPATDWTPVAGFISVAGRSREMQDAVCVQTGFCQPEIFRRRPLHFYAVYDGHGGSHVATLCSKKVHMHLKEELMRMESMRQSVGARNTDAMQETQQQIQGAEEEEKEVWRRALKRSFKRTDEMALSMCLCGRVGYQCELHSKEEVMLIGSTAVVAVLTPDHIIVANCGDSRAVLCRSGISIPLSVDHKPDRSDERARIEACNGRVIFRNGARVEGILAVSRAIGDRYLKPSVTSEPEITFTKRDPGDECLILASDGLWDVVKNETACNVALQCLRERSPVAATYRNTETRIEDATAGALFTSQSELAAAILTRLALGRMSGDNISVIVVDLRVGEHYPQVPLLAPGPAQADRQDPGPAA